MISSCHSKFWLRVSVTGELDKGRKIIKKFRVTVKSCAHERLYYGQSDKTGNTHKKLLKRYGLQKYHLQIRWNGQGIKTWA